MKKHWQGLPQRLTSAWASCWRRVATLVGLVKWRVALGTAAGVALAALVYFALANQRTTRPPQHSLVAKNEHQQVAQRIQAILPASGRPGYTSFSEYLDFNDSLDAVATRLQEQESSRHSLTLRELLRFRQQVVAQNAQLYNGLNLLRAWRLKLVVDSTRSAEESELSSDLVASQRQLLAITDSLQQDLALMQLRYLQLPGRESSLLRSYQLELAKLQLSDSRALEQSNSDTLADLRLAERPIPRPTLLTRQKLALATTLELQQGEAASKRDAIVRQLLDSCQREVYLLRWLDSCRAQQSWGWFAEDSLPASMKPDTSSLPHALDNETSSFSQYLPMVLLALFLLVVPLPFVLLFLGRRQTTQGLQAAPAPPAQELEPPVLRLLLQAYAGHIRTLLRTPRQIKRFAGKVRLQHHLLGALAQQSQAEKPFSFGPAEQVLAFALLLLIEEGAQSKYQLNQNEAEFTQHLQEVYRKACAEGQLHAALDKQFLFRRGKVWLRFAQANTDLKTLVVFRAPFAEDNPPDEVTERLLKQLYWMNAGLLV